MTHDTYKYRFDESVPAQELEDTFMLAMLAVESLHGRSRVRMESRFNLDKARRTCVIDATTSPAFSPASPPRNTANARS